MAMTWSPVAPDWGQKYQCLLPAQHHQPQTQTLGSIIKESDAFTPRFPIDSGRCKTLKTLVKPEILERNINSVYPIVHENALQLYADFLLLKQQHGNPVEKSVYQHMDLLQFIDRLLTKRAVTFMGKYDFYILKTGQKGKGGWESIGTVAEKAPLVLRNCLSYEEAKLSAFLSVSSYTHFVNKGDRKNFGVYQTSRQGVEPDGIIIGVMGARLVKPRVMEYEEVIVSKQQNSLENGYGSSSRPSIHQLFAQFYALESLEFKDVDARDQSRFTSLTGTEYFDNLAYYKRLLFTIDTLLMEAESRAALERKSAFIHVVGLGLGVWRKHPCQNQLFVDAVGQRVQALASRLHSVSDVCFSYIPVRSCLGHKHGQKIVIAGHPGQGITVHINKREPHSALEDPSKLLVVSYAWDGNALPGNEYWNKKLGSSGDSAAASSTQVAEIHNPFINPMVSAGNLRIVAHDGVIGVGEYLLRIRHGVKRKA